jgi:signal transduction histidine kinase
MILAATAAFATIFACCAALSWRCGQRRSQAQAQQIAELQRTAARAAAEAEAARAEAAKLRETLDALPMPLWRRDRKGVLVDCNHSYAAAIGAPRTSVIGEQRELCAVVSEAGAAAGAEATPVRVHAVIDGRRRLLEINEASGAGGDTIGWIVDRTDIETAEAELQRHTSAHAAVLETLSAGVAIFGSDKRLKFFNSSFTVLWDLDAAWLETEPTVGDILEHLHEARLLPEYADFRAFKRERCALFTALIEDHHELMHLPDGRTLQLTIAAHPFGGLIYVFDDVSDRLALECSFNTLAQVQRATLDHLFEGIAVYGGDGRLKLHNPAFLALWGLSEADIAGEPHIAEIVDKTRKLLDHGAEWPRRRDELIALVTSPALTSGPLYRRDGSMLQVASVPLPDGEVLLTYLDVSDTARVEQALRERNEALETVARLKAEFLANVSYELRTPLNTIIGFTEILHHEYFGSLNPSQREYSSGILDSAHQLLTLINDIIDLASIDASYVELHRAPVDVARMLQAIAALTNERARGRGLAMEWRCPPRIGAIRADERRLKQALFNLVSNAIRFTPPGGIIRIEAERAERELLLSVAEIAQGFAPGASDIPGRGERAPAQGGSGIGLSLVKSLIELHGGSIEIDIVPGRATRVICRLPIGDFEIAGASDETTRGRNRRSGDSPCEAVV